VLADAFPEEERGRAFGYNSIGWKIGAILGILLGGVIITYVSWRWVFWINVPTGVMALTLALRVLRDSAPRQHIDLVGMPLLGAGLFGVLYAMTKLATASLSDSILAALVGGVVLLVLFVWVEHLRAEPMIDLSIFKMPTLSPTLLAALFQGLANFAALFLVLMYLQGMRRLTPSMRRCSSFPATSSAGSSDLSAAVSRTVSGRCGRRQLASAWRSSHYASTRSSARRRPSAWSPPRRC
jgi:hypothetical protein